jgi:haloalkane dehalogenase
VDHIGCGLSDKPAEYDYTLAGRTADLLALVEALDLQQISLIAHDWGGAIGLGAALLQPKRFARLILLNTGAYPPPRVPWRILACRTPLLGKLAVRGLNLFARAALRMAVASPQGLDAATRAGLIAPYNNWANRVAVHAFVKDIPLSKNHPTWHTLEVIEAGLLFLANRPARFIWGMRDWCFTRESMDRMKKSLPQAEICMLESAGHYVLEDAPQEVLHLVREFLERTDSQIEATQESSQRV